MSDLDEIRRRADIVDLVSERVKLKRAGVNFVGLCPFHNDKKPSFTVSPSIGRYKCWSCNAGGDCFTWVMETQRVDFKEALEILATKYGVALTKSGPKRDDEPHKAAMQEALDFFVAQLQSNTVAKEYATARNLPQSVLEEWEVGFAPGTGDALARHLQKKGHRLDLCRELFLVEADSSGGYYDRFRSRLMFPIRDERNELVAFGGRTTINDDRKYINSSDTPLFHKSRVLYGMNKAKPQIAKSRTAVLVEGYLDVISCHRSGVTTAVATLGTSLADEHVKVLKRWSDKVIVLYDSDPAGQKAAERACDMCEEAELNVKVALMPPGDDPDSLLKASGPQAVAAAVERAENSFDFRITMFRARNAVDSDVYWEEAVRVLAKAPNELELLRVLPKFASEYPGSKDKEAAVAALRTMVVRHKRKVRGDNRERGDAGSPESRPPAAKSEAWLGSEITIFQALAHASLVSHALKILKVDGLLVSKDAVAAARAVVELDSNSAISHKIGEWLPMIGDESILDRLAEIFIDPVPLVKDALDEAEARLQELAAKRQLSEMIESADDDETLRRYHDRQKDIKGSKAEKDDSE